MWLGASPELLLHIYGNEFRTMSLAGTSKYSATTTVQWGTKELTEQALVTRYIQEALEGIVGTISVDGPKTIRAGELLHLQTAVKGTMGTAKLEDLITALHPTAAVCGLPKAASLKFLQQHENYDRAYYAGYMGELNLGDYRDEKNREQANVYVNLRCMSIGEKMAAIYVGGGITIDSKAEMEWEETRAKAGTMLRVLQ